MNNSKTPVTVSGGRTGIVGGAVPEGGALLSLEHMNQILSIGWDDDSQEWRLTVQPGITLRELQERIATKNFGENGNRCRDLSRFLKDPDQYFYPPDPTEDSASLGGTIATDASGARTYFYGRTREHVRAIRVALMNGEILSLRRGEHHTSAADIVHLRHLDGTTTDIPIPGYERPQVKCATGFYSTANMDLLDVFIGSEGTLGVITEAEIALKKKPQSAIFLAFFPSSTDATAFVIRLRASGKGMKSLVIHSMEYIDNNSLRLLRENNEDRALGIKLPETPAVTAILCEFAYNEAETAIQQLIDLLHEFHSPVDSAISGIGERDKDRLKRLRHAVPESINRIISRRKKDIPGLHKLGTDTSVPDDKLPYLMELYDRKLRKSGLEHYLIGHIAENHLHVNILPRSQAELIEGESLVSDLAACAVALGGAVSAEHGVGKVKRALMKLMYSDAQINQMMSLKHALDPNWILSRGNMFAPP